MQELNTHFVAIRAACEVSRVHSLAELSTSLHTPAFAGIRRIDIRCRGH